MVKHSILKVTPLVARYGTWSTKSAIPGYKYVHTEMALWRVADMG